MKKQLVALGALLATIVGFSAMVQAATPVAGSARVFLASATTGGTLKAEFGIKLRPVANPDGTGADLTRIAWSGALPNGGWKIANTVLKTTWTVTDANGGITIYTDNQNAAALPRFVPPLPADPHNVANDPSGLLRGTSGTTSSPGLSLGWSIKPSSMVVNGAGDTGIRPEDPNAATSDSYLWFYMVDKSNPGIDFDGDGWDPVNDDNDTEAFAYGSSYVTMIRFNGIHQVQSGDFSSGYAPDPDKTSYVYIEANFASATAQTTYQTSRVTVEAYLQ